MPENKNPGVEKGNNVEAPKKRSFFGGSLDANSKDFLDFRYNTQEEIDKFNEEMTVTSDLDEIMKQKNNTDSNESIYENMDDKNESDLEQNIDTFNETLINDGNNKYIKNYEEEIQKPIEGEIIEDPDTNKEDDEEKNNEYENAEEFESENINNIEEPKNKIENGHAKEDSELKEKNDNEGFRSETNKEESEVEEQENEKEAEGGNFAKFFDPFELNLDEDDNETSERNTENFDPFGLDKENESEDEHEEYDEKNDENEITENVAEEGPEKIIEETDNNNEKKDNEDNENNQDNGDEQKIDNEDDNTDNDEDEKEEDFEDEKGNEQDNTIDNENKNDPEEDCEYEISEINTEENHTNDDEETQQTIKTNEEEDEENDEDKIVINTPIVIDPNKKDKKEESLKNRKIKKNSTTGEMITGEEVHLEQGQDMPNTENDEEYQLTDEELFEHEPEFFGDDRLSQQFMQLVKNTRGIFKLERKDGEQNPYFKILGGKTTGSTLEYLFYLIEEENEPIDLYIKKVETIQETGEENEHLVQFSYNEYKELNIFVDEIILYEKINKSDSNTQEYSDTKTILEKFIFLTNNYYNKLKAEIDKQREEKQKKKQLQQIFKGF